MSYRITVQDTRFTNREAVIDLPAGWITVSLLGHSGREE